VSGPDGSSTKDICRVPQVTRLPQSISQKGFV